MAWRSTGFHDAFVRRITIGAESLLLETDAFSLSFTETMPPGRVLISGHRTLLKNELEVGAFEIESDDAEINILDVSNEEVRLVLFWHAWAPKRSSVCAGYRFPGATLRVEAEDGGPLVPFQSPADEA